MLIHTEAPSFRCEECDSNFKSQLELEWHTETTHDENTQSKELKCNQCEFKSRQDTELRKHIESSHKEDYKYCCDSCEFGSNFIAEMWKPITLRRHLYPV